MELASVSLSSAMKEVSRGMVQADEGMGEVE